MAFIGRSALINLTGLLIATLLSLSLMSTIAVAQAGQWQQVANKTNCVVWNPAPEPNEKATWSGACANGRAQGKGTQIMLSLKNGQWEESKFIGTMKDGKQHGRGFLEWADGGTYDGELNNGNLHGHGILIFPNGEKYDGTFRDTNFNGYGVYVWPNGERYAGYWKDGMHYGFGIYEWPNGRKYAGEWKTDMPNGSGTGIVGPETYTGYWTNGCFTQGNRQAAIATSMRSCGFE